MGMYDMLGFDPLQSGWIPPDERTPETTAAHNEIIESTPVISCSGPSFARPKWSVAWAYTDRVAGIEQFRRKGQFKNLRQNTGSCVGLSVTNMILWSGITDAVYFADPTRVVFPFFGYHYGLGRLESGIRGRGEGSSGSGQARALEKYGFLPFDAQGVPQPNNGEVIDWPGSTEIEWSDGDRLPQQHIAEGSQHKFDAVTRATSVEQAVDLMSSRYWGTTASNWGGLMRCPVVGTGQNAHLLNRHAGTWNHQQGVYGYWYHPDGLRIAIGNQWAYVHGTDSPRVEDDDAPPPMPDGMYWIGEIDFAYMLRAGETFFFGGAPNFATRKGRYQTG